MNEELKALIRSGLLGLAIGSAISLPILIIRWIRKEKLFKKPNKPTPAWTWPLGILLFGFLGIVSFLTSRPIFGTFFTLLCDAYIIGCVCNYKKKNITEPQR
jgi:hypothetical protein